MLGRLAEELEEVPGTHLNQERRSAPSQHVRSRGLFHIAELEAYCRRIFERSLYNAKDREIRECVKAIKSVEDLPQEKLGYDTATGYRAGGEPLLIRAGS